MLTKIIILLGLLVLLFGVGAKRRPCPDRGRLTNALLAVVAVLLVLMIVTTLFSR